VTRNRKQEKLTYSYLRQSARVRITDEYHFTTGWAQTRRAGHQVNEFEAAHRLYRRVNA